MLNRTVFVAALCFFGMWIGGLALSENVPQSPHRAFRIGLLSDTGYFSEHATAAQWDAGEQLAGLRLGMKDLGIVENKDWVLIPRIANRDHALLDRYAAELVAMKVDVIAASSTTAAIAARQVTRSIPIVAWAATLGDTIPTGNGSNITGFKGSDEVDEHLEQLQMVVPGLKRVAVLYDTSYAVVPALLEKAKTAAKAAGLELIFVEVKDNESLAPAFDRMANENAQALLVLNHPRFHLHPQEAPTLALKYRLPMVGPYRETAEAGGLIAHHPDWQATWRRGAKVIKQILDGTPPAEIPVQTGVMRNYINVTTANALGLTIPDSMRQKSVLVSGIAKDVSTLPVELKASAISGLAATAEAQKAQIIQLQRDYELAWNRHDAAALASFYTEDGDAIFPSGKKASGRSAIEAAEAANHNSINRFSHATRKINNIRFLAPNVAAVDSSVEITGMTNQSGESLPVRHALMTTVLVQESGKWQIAANRAMLPVATSPSNAATNDEDSIRRQETAFVDAILHFDKPKLERLLAADCIVVVPGGGLRNKEEEIQFAGSGILRFESWQNKAINVRIYGATAVVNRLDEVHMRSASEDRSGMYRYTNVWVHEDGEWRMVSHQPAGPFRVDAQQKR